MRTSLNIIRRTLGPFLTDPEKQSRTFASLATLFLITLSVFGIWPLTAEVVKLSRELSQGQRSNDLAKVKIDNLNKAIKNFNQIKPILPKVDQDLPVGKDLPHLLERLNFIFGSQNVTLEEIRPEAEKPSDHQDTSVLTLYLRASGSYEDLLSAVSGIETSSRQMNVTSLSIEIPQKGNRSLLDVSIKIETFFLNSI